MSARSALEEIPPARQTRARGGQIAGRDRPQVRARHVALRGGRLAFDRERDGGEDAGERRRRDQPHLLHSGRPRQTRRELLGESRQVLRGAVRRRQRDARLKSALGREAEGDALEAVQALDEEHGPDEEDQGGGDLGDDERVAHAAVPPVAHRSPSRHGDRRAGARPENRANRDDREQDRGRRRQPEREEEERSVHPDLSGAGDRGGREGERGLAPPGGEDETEPAARRREQQSLEPELPHQVRSGRAERDADGELAGAFRGPDEQEAEQVRERGAEDEDDRGEEQEHRPPVVADQSVLQRVEAHGVLAGVIGGELFAQRGADRGQLRLRRLAGDAGLQAADESQEVGRASQMAEGIAIGHERDDDVDVAERQGELTGENADDLVGLGVDADGLPDGVGSSAEEPLPEPVGDDRHGRRVRTVVGIAQEAPGRGLGPEDVEDVGRHARALEALHDAAGVHARAPVRVGGEAGEAARLPAIVHVLGERERRGRIVGPHGRDVHEPLRRAVGEGAQEHRVDDGEHRRGRADRERQRRDDGQREPRLAAALAKGDAKIRPESVHGVTSAAVGSSRARV